LGGVLAISLGSLAGIPPLAGFAAKLLLFVAAYQAGLYYLLGVSILGVILSIYYYFNWMREAAFIPTLSEGAEAAEPRPLTLASFWSRTLMTILAMLTVGFGFWQGLLHW
jgi:NADH-quinone oxidoreductase subunit N